ncbi:hypothetical protein ADL22_23450 [Streptomyces sp. NRRL F-4489]|uniref:hypothetical protein n=1 Tax=Streptomyces sp. NRRL F-4489 TaxID=1609095 RepID=UPI000749E2B0|nr:hypothetical protein [Streptomyces sp. NRRL F-4489]KUL36857.1 hypothetical protein ADL22_23450 [Streptomyces sp. NRRL F-4489]
MEDATKALVAAALAGGYVLGRTKKARFALSLASYLGGRQFGLDPRHLVRDGARKLGDIPQVAELGEQLRGEVMTAGRQAVTTAAHRGVASLADSLHERTRRLTEGEESSGDEETSGDEEESEGGPSEDESAEEETARSRDESSEAESSGERKGTTARKAAEKKTAPRKPAERKPAARKAAERKPAGKKAAGKETAGRSAPAKKAAARKKAAPGSRKSAEKASPREGRRR